MNDQLLLTKLFIPPLRSKRIDRPHLIEKLNQGVENGFVLVSAPAGYGKTTLICSWLSQLNFPHTWLSLDPSDNDLIRFLHYLAAALSAIDPVFGDVLENSLRLNPHASIETLLTPVLNRISQSDYRIGLVFDDFHVIQDQKVNQAVRFLLEHRPNGLFLVIATRTDPFLPLSLFRAHAEIFELRLADLQFSTSECGKFFSNVLGLDISQEDLSILSARTEGWVAGLQMIGLSMQNHSDISNAIAALSREDRYILEFFFEEIFRNQSAQVQDFLIKTSILNRLCASLCDQVVGHTNSQAILKFLEENNLFLIALDENGEWFRYHTLFQVLLQKQVNHLTPGTTDNLFLKASQWFEESGNLVQAILHAFDAHDLSRTAELIERAADATLMKGEIKTFLGWCEQLPDEIASQRPLLSLYHAEALLLVGKPIDSSLHSLVGTPEYAAIEALKASFQGNVILSRRLSAQVLDTLPQESRFLRCVITSALGAVLLLGGDVDSAIDTFHASKELARKCRNRMFEVIALCRLGQLYHLKGESHEAERTLIGALDLSRDRSGAYLSLASMPLMILASLKLEQDQLETAQELILEAIKLSDAAGGFWSVDCHLVHAQVLHALGENHAALAAMGIACEIARQTEANPFDDIYTAAYQARLNLDLGRLNEAQDWVMKTGLNRLDLDLLKSVRNRYSQELFHLLELELMTAARVLLLSNQAGAALTFLIPFSQEIQNRHRTLSLIENYLLQALCHQAQGNRASALNRLEQALMLAEPAGISRTFLGQGVPVQELMVTLLDVLENEPDSRGEQTHRLAKFIRKLMHAYQSQKGHAPLTSDAAEDTRLKTAMPNPSEELEALTQREIDVLTLLAQGLSNKEIAQQLVIAGGTVHKHLKNIYSKLDVHNRTAAIARARGKGWIN